MRRCSRCPRTKSGSRRCSDLGGRWAVFVVYEDTVITDVEGVVVLDFDVVDRDLQQGIVGFLDFDRKEIVDVRTVWQDAVVLVIELCSAAGAEVASALDPADARLLRAVYRQLVVHSPLRAV